jgi:peptide/nickel transport system substrate-binding protein
MPRSTSSTPSFWPNPKVRQAIKYLIDYDGMQNSFLKGQYTIHQNFLPLTYLGAVEENPFSLDIEKAKALLAEAGRRRAGDEAGVREAQERLEIAQSLQNTMAQAGITLKLTVGTGRRSSALPRARAGHLSRRLGAGLSGPAHQRRHLCLQPRQLRRGAADRHPGLAQQLGHRRADRQVDAPRWSRTTPMCAPRCIATSRRSSANLALCDHVPADRTIGMRDNVENFSTGQAITAASYWPVTK